MPIETSLEQAEIADSILDAPIVGNHADPNWAIDTVADERMAEEWPNEQADFAESDDSEPEAQAAEQVDADELGQRLADEYEHEQILNLAEASLNQPQQPVERTPQEVEEGIQSLAAAVEANGLNDEGSAFRLAYSLAPFGVNPESIDTKAFGQTMSMAVVSSLNSDGADSVVPPLAAARFANDFLGSLGIPPQSVNSQQLATVVHRGIRNFADAVAKYGPNAPMNLLNSPDGSQAFGDAIHQVFGINAPMSPDVAMHLAYGAGRYILGIWKQLESRQAQAQQPQPMRGAGRQGRQRKAAASKVPWSSNRDIFDSESVELYRQNHGRL